MSTDRPLRIGLAGCQAGLETLPLTTAIDLLAEAERAGLDGVWVNEEHLAGRHQGRVCWATLPFLCYLAGRVPRIRLGAAALILPLHHPLRLAEEIASLCRFAPGRVAIGVAPNRPGPYAEAFGSNLATRPSAIRGDFDACLKALQALLRGERTTILTNDHVGWEASSGVEVAVPPPFLRAAHSPESVRAAAQARMPLLQHYVQSPTSIAASRRWYREAAGEDADSLLYASPVHRFVLIAEDDAAAREAALHCARLLRLRLHVFGADQGGFIAEPAALEADRFVEETAVVGSPATVAARLSALAASAGTGTVNVNLGWMGVVDAERVLRSARLLIDEVLPRRTAGRVGGPGTAGSAEIPRAVPAPPPRYAEAGR